VWGQRWGTTPPPITAFRGRAGPEHSHSLCVVDDQAHECRRDLGGTTRPGGSTSAFRFPEVRQAAALRQGGGVTQRCLWNGRTGAPNVQSTEGCDPAKRVPPPSRCVERHPPPTGRPGRKGRRGGGGAGQEGGDGARDGGPHLLQLRLDDLLNPVRFQAPAGGPTPLDLLRGIKELFAVTHMVTQKIFPHLNKKKG